MEIKQEPNNQSMSPIKPMKTFSLAILNQMPKMAKTEVVNNNQSESINTALINEKKTRQYKDKKSFKCYVCGKHFGNSKAFRIHKLIHTDERPFKCGICDKAFNDPSSTRKHRLIHKSERSYKCDVCEKSFKQPAGFRQHRLIHTSEASFKCGICNKDFKLESYLRRHRLIHTIDQKLFECVLCKIRFNHSRAFKYHLTKYHH